VLAATRSPQDAEILRLAIPAFGALIAEPLFLLADSAIVGRIGTVPLGGLGVAGQALSTLVGISVFLAYGTTAAVARQVGAGHGQAAIRQGIDGLWLAAMIGLVVLGAGWPLAPAIAGAFGGSAAVTAQAVIYLRISLLGAPAMLAVLAGTGVLRGLQDTRTPLLVAVVAAAVIALFLVLRYTRLGKAMRATAANRSLARNCGIRTDRVITVTWALTGGLCGLAGVVFAMDSGSFDATATDLFLVLILAAVFLGGPGQAYGAMLGAVVIGLATEVSAAYITADYKYVVAFVALLIMLGVRPTGLIGARA